MKIATACLDTETHPALYLPATLSAKGKKSIKVKVLADSGAECYALVNPSLAHTISQQFDIYPVPLIRKIQVQAFNRKVQETITHKILPDLTVGQHSQKLCSMQITPLAPGDEILLGRLWFQRHGALIDCAASKLVWLKERSTWCTENH